MDVDIALWLLQDAVTNGAIYVLLALAVVLVYTVTRVVFIPQGAFISFAALSLATLQSGKVPGTAYLVVGGGLLVLLVEAVGAARGPRGRRNCAQGMSSKARRDLHRCIYFSTVRC